MVQASRNWSQITGRIVAVDESGAPPGFVNLQLVLDDVQELADFPNMLKDAGGSTIEVAAPVDRIREKDLKLGDRLTATLRVVGPGRTVADPNSIEREPIK